MGAGLMRVGNGEREQWEACGKRRGRVGPLGEGGRTWDDARCRGRGVRICVPRKCWSGRDESFMWQAGCHGLERGHWVSAGCPPEGVDCVLSRPAALACRHARPRLTESDLHATPRRHPSQELDDATLLLTRNR